MNKRKGILLLALVASSAMACGSPDGNCHPESCASSFKDVTNNGKTFSTCDTCNANTCDTTVKDSSGATILECSGPAGDTGCPGKAAQAMLAYCGVN